jgi:hypothetical protein
MNTNQIQELQERYKGRLQNEHFSNVFGTNISSTDRYILDRIYALEDKIDRLIDAIEKPKGDL